MRRGKPDPLAANIVHVGEDRGDGANATFTRWFACRCLCFPYSMVKMFDEHLVDAVVQQKHPSAGVLHVTSCHFADIQSGLAEGCIPWKTAEDH